jgi:hypothetical protein
MMQQVRYSLAGLSQTLPGRRPHFPRRVVLASYPRRVDCKEGHIGPR